MRSRGESAPVRSGATGAYGFVPACILAFVLLLSVPACRPRAESDARPPGREFSVTAYCTGRITQSGARVKPGMAAADPRVLPVGSTIRVDGQGKAYDGIYTVTDTGPAIRGRELDLYISDCAEAKRFGRRTMRVALLRRGWKPSATGS
jgi:3D (Asp-Asp-Asp) domain-containing protein